MKEKTLAICPKNGNRIAYLTPTSTGSEVWVSETVDTTTGRVAHWTRINLDAIEAADELHANRHAYCAHCHREYDWTAADLATQIHDLDSNPKKKPLVLIPA